MCKTSDSVQLVNIKVQFIAISYSRMKSESDIIVAIVENASTRLMILHSKIETLENIL